MARWLRRVTLRTSVLGVLRSPSLRMEGTSSVSYRARPMRGYGLWVARGLVGLLDGIDGLEAQSKSETRRGLEARFESVAREFARAGRTETA